MIGLSFLSCGILNLIIRKELQRSLETRFVLGFDIILKIYQIIENHWQCVTTTVETLHR